MLKQFRIPFDVKIHIDNVFAKKIQMVMNILISSTNPPKNDTQKLRYKD